MVVGDGRLRLRESAAAVWFAPSARSQICPASAHNRRLGSAPTASSLHAAIIDNTYGARTAMAVTPRTQPALSVSLEDHLADTLRPLRTLLPEPLAAELTQILDNAPPTSALPHSPPRTIPYDLLAAISKWSRSPAGHSALASHDPPLPVQDYVLLALLAGTRTSPERKFPLLQTPSPDGEASRRRELEDRRAVTAVLNALLSILCSGLATWWAAGRLVWKDEWVSDFLRHVRILPLRLCHSTAVH